MKNIFTLLIFVLILPTFQASAGEPVSDLSCSKTSSFSIIPTYELAQHSQCRTNRDCDLRYEFCLGGKCVDKGSDENECQSDQDCRNDPDYEDARCEHGQCVR